ncbi:hypothetical protein Tco_0354975 [Tanacetum coccineum]
MVTDLEDSKTHTVGEVWSREYMDHGFTKSMSELERCYTMLQELRSVIVGGALIHKNREGSKNEGRRIRPTIGDFKGNCASNQSPFNNGRIEEWEKEKKEDRVSTTKIFHSKILIRRKIAMVSPKVTQQLPKPEVKVEVKIVIVPLKLTPQLPNPGVKVEEKILKAEIVEDHIEKIQDLQSYKQHDEKISTLLFKTTNKVGTLKTCEEIRSYNDDEDVNGFNCIRVDVKHKSIEDKVRREVFDVDEALDIENSRASSFQVRGIHVDETNANEVRDWSSPKTLLEVRNNKVVDLFQEEDELEYAEPLDGEAEQVTYVVQRTLCSPKGVAKKSSLNDAKKTAVVTAVTTAGANDQMAKTNLQVSLRDNPALDTPIECLRTPS